MVRVELYIFPSCFSYFRPLCKTISLETEHLSRSTLSFYLLFFSPLTLTFRLIGNFSKPRTELHAPLANPRVEILPSGGK